MNNRTPPIEETVVHPILLIENVAKSFRTPQGKSVDALKDINLSIRTNEFLTLLGPSGCGKTTLLRIVGGFETQDSGEIRLDGEALGNMPAYRRPVNTMFQSYALFPHMSVARNVRYGLETKGHSSSEMQRKVGEALELVGLNGMETRKPHRLSGGQRQRVALARAIVNQPRILLLDEPLSALDRKLRQHMQVELKNLQHELGITFVSVTHDQEEALSMSDRVVVMSNGEISQVGKPAEIYEHPGSRFVAEFVGESNILDGKITALDNGCASVRTESGIDLIVRCRGEEATGDQVTVVIRPENLSLQADPSDRAFRSLHCNILNSTYFGSDIQLHAETNGHPLLVRIPRREAAGLSTDAAQSTELFYNPDDLHLIKDVRRQI